MNADTVRHLYDYHFAQNRHTWSQYVAPLPQDQFIQPTGYSIGSVRDQMVHMMSDDDMWFCGLRGEAIPSLLDPSAFDDRAVLRGYWDIVEQTMRDYLATVTDAMLSTQPLDGEDEHLYLWQVLLHVVNHGTDHRAQVQRLLHDLGVATSAQDYIFYVYDHP